MAPPAFLHHVETSHLDLLVGCVACLDAQVRHSEQIRVLWSALKAGWTSLGRHDSRSEVVEATVQTGRRPVDARPTQ